MKKEKHTSRESLLDMMGLDIYLNSLSKAEYHKVADQLTTRKQVISPLISWEYFMISYKNNIQAIKRSRSIAAMRSLQITHQWEDDPTDLLTSPFEGLVLTNSDLVIEWVNAGFTEMTGYSSNFSLGKTPRFLQGKNTSNEARKRIRKHIKANRPFKESIINYRKNGEEYRCQIEVFPLKSKAGVTSHFLALETEIR